MRIRNPFTTPSRGPKRGTDAWSPPDRADRHRVDALLLGQFLSVVECAELCAAMDRAPSTEGGVRETDHPENDSVDRTGRRASDCMVPDETTRWVTDRICRSVPAFTTHFDQELAEYEEPHFVVYAPGDFYRPHRDLYPDVAIPEPLRRRRVSVVVFLNDADDDDDLGSERALPASERGYRGGVLRLCSHEAPDFDARSAWDVPAERGLLVAFRADTWHEVTPITAGTRYTIVALLLAPRSDAP